MRKLLTLLLACSSHLFANDCIQIINTDNEFAEQIPCFILGSTREWDTMHWQVAEDAEFTQLIPTMDTVQPYTSALELDSLSDAFLSAGKTYYFRVKGEKNGGWSLWSEGFAFTTERPELSPSLRSMACHALGMTSERKFHKHSLTPYAKNPYVSDEVWDKLSPYFLPIDHPARDALDQIFKKRVTQSPKTLKKARFDNPKERRHSHVFVTKHKKLKGYLVKLYTDQQEFEDWPSLLHRIEGAQSIKAAINRYGVGAWFKVPQKWLYPLPADPAPRPGSFRKNFVLVVEDMKILHGSKNKAKWASSSTTKEKLSVLYRILNEEGLHDSCIIVNIPYSTDGRISFIDTEHHHDWPVYFHRLTGHLPPALQAHWQHLIDTDGN